MADETQEKKKEQKTREGQRKPGEGGGGAGDHGPKVVSNAAAVAPRFIAKYAKEVVPALTKQFGYTNPNQVPKLEKVVINMGLGQAVTNPKIIDSAVDELRAL